VSDGSLPVAVPANLKPVSDDDLTGFAEQLRARGKALQDEPNVSAELVSESLQIQRDFERVDAEIKGRAFARQEAAEAEARRLEAARRDALSSVVAEETVSEDGDEGQPSGNGDGARLRESAIKAEEIAAATARGVVATLASVGALPHGMKADEAATRATTALQAAAIRTRPRDQLPERRLAVTAGVDIPGVGGGQDLVTIDDLTRAVNRRAKAMPVTRDGLNARGAIVASIRNEFEHVVDDRHTPAEVEDLLQSIRRKDAQEALLAGGGWCAPSEIRYDFFNIADPPDGTVDLPTVGISRGGLRYPTSPSLADVIGAAFGGFSATFSSASVPFLWSESDDVATVTGTPNKPTVRVPCPSFNEARLEVYGFQVTAGNLTDDAYPEATRNFLRMVLAAHEHAMNGRIIALMVAGSSSAITTGSFAASGAPVFNQISGGLGLAAADYRARYGMNDGAVLEAVAPKWLLGAIASDLGYRQGGDPSLLSVTRAQIDGYMAARGVRVQWVDDWQVRATGLPGVSGGLTAWPGSADILLYAAGTFLLGNGLTLDLGVIRDSVLNAENDFTAAFTEEAHLIAKVGHESRRYTVKFSVNGASPAALAAGSYL
jgi:hypothetical protein